MSSRRKRITKRPGKGQFEESPLEARSAPERAAAGFDILKNWRHFARHGRASPIALKSSKLDGIQH
jgi:hypothetical protein